MKYRKKPVMIEADVYKPGMEDGFACYSIRGSFLGFYDKKGPMPRAEQRPALRTLEGWHEISEGDYIITSIKGEKYPCKPDIFHQTYEPVEGD